MMPSDLQNLFKAATQNIAQILDHPQSHVVDWMLDDILQSLKNAQELMQDKQEKATSSSTVRPLAVYPIPYNPHCF